MLKLIVSGLLLATYALAADVNSNEKTYTFKAKGEFAEELKALIQKHSKEGEVEITEEKDTKPKSRYRKKKKTLVEAFLTADEELSGDLAYGQEIYDKTCYRCHGTKADKSSYPSARVLNTLSKKELYEALWSYKTDSSYGGASKFIMYNQAGMLGSEEMVSVSAYIYSLTHSKSKATAPIDQPEEDKEKQGVQGTYLK